MTTRKRENVTVPQAAVMLGELVDHLRQNRTELREQWARRIAEAKL